MIQEGRGKQSRGEGEKGGRVGGRNGDGNHKSAGA